MARPLKRAKNSLIFATVAGLIWLLSWLPHRAAVAVGRSVGWLGYWIGGRERRRALHNLRLAGFDEGLAARRKLVRQMFVELGRSALECVVLRRRGPRLVSAPGVVQFVGRSRETLLRLQGQGRGVLFVTGHLGNWELMAAAVASLAPVSVLFRPSYDPRFTRLISDFRLKNGVCGIDVTRLGHVKQVLAALAHGHVVGVLIDQPVPSGCQVEFLGRPAWTTTLVARLHQRTGAPLVVGTIRRRAPTRHEVRIDAVDIGKAKDSQVITQEVSRGLERAIRCAPSQWAWSLDRWRSAESENLSTPNASCVPAKAE